MKNKKNIWIVLALTGIVILGFGVRIYGVEFGLPGVYHPDEERLVHHALAFGLGDFNPHYFNYPSFGMYFLFFEYVIYYLLGNLGGIFTSPSDFSATFFSDPTPFYLIGRITSVVLSTLTLVLIYRLGKKSYNRGVGVISALLLSVCFLHVRSSHFITTDIPLVLFITWAYVEIIGIMKTGRLKYYIRAGILTGLGAAFKYNAATLIIPILLAHFFSSPKGPKGLRKYLGNKVWICGGVMILTFFIATPYVFLDFLKFWEDFRGISEHMRIGVYGTGGGTHYLGYVQILFWDNIYYGPTKFNPLGFFWLLGLVWALWRHRKKELVLGIYPLIYFLLIGSWGVCNIRYFLPIFPGLVVFAGAGVWAIWQKGNRYLFFRVFFPCVLIFIIFFPLRNIILYDYMMAQPDTRTLALHWIEENIPPNTGIAIEWDNNATVPLCENIVSIKKKIQGYRQGALSTVHHPPEQMEMVHELRLKAGKERGYELIRLGEVDGLTLIPKNYDLVILRNRGVKYLVLSSGVFKWFQNKKMRDKYPIHTKFYDEILNNWIPVKVFKTTSGTFTGPEIRIYHMVTPAGGKENLSRAGG